MEWLLLVVAIFVIVVMVSLFHRRNRKDYETFLLQNGELMFLTYDEFKAYWNHNLALKSKSSNYVRVYCIYRVEFTVGAQQFCWYVRTPKAFNELSTPKKELFISMAYQDQFDAAMSIRDIDFDSFV